MSNIELKSKGQFNNYPDILTIKDIQSILRIGRTKAYRLIKDGSIKHIDKLKPYRIPKVYLIEYTENS